MNLGQWIGLISLIAALYILWQIRKVILLLFAAVVLANSLNILARWFQQKGLTRSGAVLVAIACFFSVLVAFFYLIVPPFAVQFQELLVLVPEGINRLNIWLSSLNRLVPSQFREYVPSITNLTNQIFPVINQLLGGSVAFFSSSLGAVVNILLIVVLGLMFLIDPLAYRRALIRLMPSFYRRRIDEILQECEFSLGRWIEGALISMSVIAVLSTLGLSIIGVKAALAQGILAGLLNFIPNIGPSISVIPPMMIALLDSPFKSLLVLVLFILIQQFESNFLTPYVMAQHVNLLPAITLLAQVFFASLFGFWGLLLALPLTVVAQILVRRVLMEDVLDQWQAPGAFRFGASTAAVDHPDPIAQTAIVTETVIHPAASPADDLASTTTEPEGQE